MKTPIALPEATWGFAAAMNPAVAVDLPHVSTTIGYTAEQFCSAVSIPCPPLFHVRAVLPNHV